MYATALSTLLLNLNICSSALAPHLGVEATTLTEADGRLRVGFESALYSEDGPTAVAILAETDSTAYLYAESCDICAEIIACDKLTGDVATLAKGHTVDCSDLEAATLDDATLNVCSADQNP